jgi:predicted ATP-grasp superfamily ATP-dependent carboligase
MSSSADVLIFGASARAAAFSALRAGLRPWCVDLFADADLAPRCPALRLPGRYPRALLDVIESAPTAPWIYVGGLENYPDLVGRLAQRRELWGNGPGVLALARSPEVLTRTARAAGLPAPEVVLGGPAGPGRWLSKPLRGAGGAGIVFHESAVPAPGTYLQQFIEGEPASALYVADGRSARLLGLTRQLVGEEWLGAPSFRYCGSVGPLEMDFPLATGVVRLGQALAEAAGLRGLFGIDGVLHGGAFWPVEVNPRYTASVEVVEHSTGLHALDWHRRAFAAPGSLPPVPSATYFVGKAVLFARQRITFPAGGPWLAAPRAPLAAFPEFADLPAPGEKIEAGRPVLTLFARAGSLAECQAALRRAAREVERRLESS